jgi:hypothetical protein
MGGLECPAFGGIRLKLRFRQRFNPSPNTKVKLKLDTPKNLHSLDSFESFVLDHDLPPVRADQQSHRGGFIPPQSLGRLCQALNVTCK